MAGDRITYILGAGASLAAFPLVKGLLSHHEGRSLATDIRVLGAYVREMQITNTDLNAKKMGLAGSLIDTGSEAERFGNIDTYAKYLYHQNDMLKLDFLKQALTFYFTWKQIVEKKFDPRYLHFITSIIDSTHKFPEHVKVITWNYDFQLEMAAGYYKSIGFKSFPCEGLSRKLRQPNENFSMVHLNSIAGMYLSKSSDNHPEDDLIDNINLDVKHHPKFAEININNNSIIFLNEYIEKYYLKPPIVSFGWEQNSRNQKILGDLNSLVKRLIEGTTVLVVIGYSFPFYNREADNEVFDVMKKSLKKIYFQDPSVDGEFLLKRYNLRLQDEEQADKLRPSQKARLLGTTPVDIEWIKDCEQFFVPIEL